MPLSHKNRFLFILYLSAFVRAPTSVPSIEDGAGGKRKEKEERKKMRNYAAPLTHLGRRHRLQRHAFDAHSGQFLENGIGVLCGHIDQ